ncbi:16279_t:CDS:1, partial [Funneliformis caledonium]
MNKKFETSSRDPTKQPESILPFVIEELPSEYLDKGLKIKLNE